MGKTVHLFSKTKQRRKLQLQLKKLGAIVLAWLLVAVLVTFYDHFNFHSVWSQGHTENYSLLENLGFQGLAALISSLLLGSWMIFYVNEELREKPYTYTLIAVAAVFFLIGAGLMLFLGGIYIYNETGQWPHTNA
ncbi:MAG: hypothetical protein HKN16_13065, partial [Saprospiraceae bacterium]|nr:hypothetical protein [Saprospiraceae bacterium]